MVLHAHDHLNLRFSLNNSVNKVTINHSSVPFDEKKSRRPRRRAGQNIGSVDLIQTIMKLLS